MERVFRGLYNISIVLFCISLILVYGVFSEIFIRDESNRLIKRARFLNKVSKFGLKLIGIKVYFKGRVNLSGEEGVFIVSNHLSYIDIVIISSIFETAFVSTTEVKSDKIFGKLASFSGSVFIDRKNRLKVREDMEKLETVLNNKINLCIFLEGTTSNGDRVLPFKSSYLEVVFKTQKPVLALCIKYKRFNSIEIGVENRDYVYYYGDHKLLNHILRFLLNLKTLDVEVIDVGLYMPKDFPSRKELSGVLQTDISEVYCS
ncbi:MAG: lysophospholipid acyltransferase family protein [Hydrogenothermaceae bacterium]